MEKFYFYSAEVLKNGLVVHRTYGTVGETRLRNYNVNMLTALEQHILAESPLIARSGTLYITAMNNVE